MYTLYGTQGSGSAAVEAALEVAGLPCRVVRASQWEPDSAQAELLQLNPLGQIPTLRLPDGSVLTESAAILIHLGLEHPASGLLPIDAAARAQAIRGLVYIAANCYSAISVGDYPERWCSDPDDATNKRVRAGARQRLHHHWDVFADQFPASPFLSGAALGGLDLLAVIVSKWSGARAHLRERRPAFFATLQRIEAHPVVTAVCARHWPAT
jgi:GST-like protein